MAKIPEHFIDDLISRSDIVEIIDHRVPLQQAGSEFKACCPFHNEKTPSFTVSPAKQFYHCFGCGAHGTVIGFLMNYDNMGFLDAVDTLAAQAGMQVPTDARPDDKTRGEIATLQTIVERANQWFQAQLKSHSEADQASAYLKNRGMDDQTATAFGLGFAPEGWDNLMQAMGASNYKALAETGLVIEKDEGGYYDRFRGRLIFPIENYRAKLIGFGGRIIGEGEPKYLNSPETKLFHKGSELYGFHRARREMGKRDEVIVVEGYMDVIGLSQCGVQNAVATLGTATTPAHLQRLFRAASKVIFCFDGDRAGKKAAWRAMKVAMPFMEDGRQIRFLLLPEGEDPDSLIRKQGRADFESRATDALSLNDFMFESLTNKLDMSQMDQRAKLAAQAKPLLQAMPQGSFKTMMYAHLSELVGATQHEGISKAPPAPEYYGDYGELSATESSKNSSQATPKIAFSKLIERALSALVQSPELIEVANEFVFDAHNSGDGFKLLDELIGMINVAPNINTGQLLERLREHKHGEIFSEFAARDLLLEDNQREIYLRDTLSRLEQQTKQLQIENLLKKGLQNLSSQERDTLKILWKQKVKN